MNRISRWMQSTFGQRQPTGHPDLPNDWLSMHILFDERYLSTKQWRALRSLDGWRPLVKIESRQLREEVTLEQQIERYMDGFGHEQKTAIHIRREETGEYGTRRNIRARNSIGEMLSVFSDEQIRIVRVADLDVHTARRDVGSEGCQATENGQRKAIRLFDKEGETNE